MRTCSCINCMRLVNLELAVLEKTFLFEHLDLRGNPGGLIDAFDATLQMASFPNDIAEELSWAVSDVSGHPATLSARFPIRSVEWLDMERGKIRRIE